MNLNSSHSSALELKFADLLEGHHKTDTIQFRGVINNIFDLFLNWDIEVEEADFNFAKLQKLDAKNSSTLELGLATIRANIGVIIEQLWTVKNFNEVMKKLDAIIYKQELEFAKIDYDDLNQAAANDVPKLDDTLVQTKEWDLSNYFTEKLADEQKIITPEMDKEYIQGLKMSEFKIPSDKAPKPKETVLELLEKQVGQKIENATDIAEKIEEINTYNISTPSWEYNFYYLEKSGYNNEYTLKKVSYKTWSWISWILKLLKPEWYERENVWLKKIKDQVTLLIAQDWIEEIENTDTWDIAYNEVDDYFNLLKEHCRLIPLVMWIKENYPWFNQDLFVTNTISAIQTHINRLNLRQGTYVFYLTEKWEAKKAKRYNQPRPLAAENLQNFSYGEVSRIPNENASIVFLKKHYEATLISQTKNSIENLEKIAVWFTQETAKRSQGDVLKELNQFITLWANLAGHLRQLSLTGWYEHTNTLMWQLRWEAWIKSFLITTIQQVNQHRTDWWFKITNRDKNDFPKLEFKKIEVRPYTNSPSTLDLVNWLRNQYWAEPDKEWRDYLLKVLCVKSHAHLWELIWSVNKQLTGLQNEKDKDKRKKKATTLAEYIIKKESALSWLRIAANSVWVTSISVLADTLEEALKFTQQLLFDAYAKKGISWTNPFSNGYWESFPYLFINSSGNLVAENKRINSSDSSTSIQKEVSNNSGRENKLSPRVQLFLLGHKYKFLAGKVWHLQLKAGEINAKTFEGQSDALEGLLEEVDSIATLMRSFRESNEGLDLFAVDMHTYLEENLTTIKLAVADWLSTIEREHELTVSQLQFATKDNVPTVNSDVLERSKTLVKAESTANKHLKIFWERKYYKTDITEEAPLLTGAESLKNGVEKNYNQLKKIKQLEQGIPQLADTPTTKQKKVYFAKLNEALKKVDQADFTNTHCQSEKTRLNGDITWAIETTKADIEQENLEIVTWLKDNDLFNEVDLSDSDTYWPNTYYLEYTVLPLYVKNKDTLIKASHWETKQGIIDEVPKTPEIGLALGKLNKRLDTETTLDAIRDMWLEWDSWFNKLVEKVISEKSWHIPTNFSDQMIPIRDHLWEIAEVEATFIPEKDLLVRFVETYDADPNPLQNTLITSLPQDTIITYLADKQREKEYKEGTSLTLWTFLGWELTTYTSTITSRFADFTDHHSHADRDVEDRKTLISNTQKKLKEMTARNKKITYPEIDELWTLTISYIWAHSLLDYSDFETHDFQDIPFDDLKSYLEHDEHIAEKAEFEELLGVVEGKITTLLDRTHFEIAKEDFYPSLEDFLIEFKDTVDPTTLNTLNERAKFLDTYKPLCLKALWGRHLTINDFIANFVELKWVREALGDEVLWPQLKELIQIIMIEYYRLAKGNEVWYNTKHDAVRTWVDKVLETTYTLIESMWQNTTNPSTYLSGQLNKNVHRKTISMVNDEYKPAATFFSTATGALDNAHQIFTTSIEWAFTELEKAEKELTHIQTVSDSFDELIQWWRSAMKSIYDLAKANNLTTSELDKHFSWTIFSAWNARKAINNARVWQKIMEELRLKKQAVQNKANAISKLITNYDQCLNAYTSEITAITRATTEVWINAKLPTFKNLPTYGTETIRQLKVDELKNKLSDVHSARANVLTSLNASYTECLGLQWMKTYTTLKEQETLIGKWLEKVLDDLVPKNT